MNQSEKAFKKLLAEGKDQNWRERTKYRATNRHWLKKSAKIAIKINKALRENNQSQRNLASKMGVSPQHINKILNGRENLTLETIAKLELALGIELISVLRRNEILFDLTESIVSAEFLLKKHLISKDLIIESTQGTTIETINWVRKTLSFRSSKKHFTVPKSYSEAA